MAKYTCKSCKKDLASNYSLERHFKSCKSIKNTIEENKINNDYQQLLYDTRITQQEAIKIMEEKYQTIIEKQKTEYNTLFKEYELLKEKLHKLEND